MAFKMKGNPYKLGKIATKSAMEMKTSYKMKEAMAKMKSPMELKKDSPMDKYKSDAQRKAVHASKAERGMTMKKKSPVPQDKSKEQSALDKQVIQIKKDMESGKLSPDQAREKLLVIQKKMKELGTLPTEKKDEKAPAAKMKDKNLGRTTKTRNVSAMKAAKPDYIDLDGDGNKTESMKKAAADKKSMAKMKKKEIARKRRENPNRKPGKGLKKEPMTIKKEATKMKKGEVMKMKKKSALEQDKKKKRKLSVMDKIKAASAAASTSKGPFGDTNFLDRYKQEKKRIRKGTFTGDSFKTG
jgi:hypothetical protein